MSDQFNKLKELKEMLDNGIITEDEFSKMKAEILLEKSEPFQEKNQAIPESAQNVQAKTSQRRTGVGWPEILAVLFGLIGGFIYLFTKQKIGKKLLILFLSFISHGFYVAIGDTNPSPNTAEVSESNPQPVATQPATQAQKLIPLGTFVDV